MKRAIVIGGSSGFGAGIVEELGNVCWTPGQVDDPRWSVTNHSRSTGFDVTKQNDVDRLEYMLNESPGLMLDAVIYSAGIAVDLRAIADGKPEDWQRVFETNAIGLLRVIRAVTPALRRSRGHLIAIGSIASQLAYKGGADYCASKAAERTIMQTYRAEIAGTGIRSTLIEPGLGDTSFQLNRYAGDADRAAKHFAGIKQLEPRDIGQAVLWILGLPWHVHVDELIIKPTEQVTHGSLHPIQRSAR